MHWAQAHVLLLRPKVEDYFMHQTTILVPTYNRPVALSATLTSLCSQEYHDFNLIISDQGEKSSIDFHSIQTILRIFEIHGNHVSYLHHPKKGLAEQRQFLLDQAKSRYVLFLDDDLILEPYVLKLLTQTIQDKECGFVGSAPIGLSFLYDERPEELEIKFWEEDVKPEKITPPSPAWKRYRLHNAANPYHIAKKLHIDQDHPRTYKIAWVGGCVLYDADKLRRTGGFSFWKDLPANHVGEDVLAQLNVMEKYGGCGILPSGVYHQELPTTIKDRSIDAPKLFS